MYGNKSESDKMLNVIATEVWEHIVRNMNENNDWADLLDKRQAHTVKVIQRVGMDGLVRTDIEDGDYREISGDDVFEFILDKMADEGMWGMFDYVSKHRDGFEFHYMPECRAIANNLDTEVYEQAFTKAGIGY